MIHSVEYGGDGSLPLSAYGLTEADVDNEPRDVEEAIDAALEQDIQAEVEKAWRLHEQSQGA